jgi:glycosyltransferase involved in cell wall biosynthesis
MPPVEGFEDWQKEVTARMSGHPRVNQIVPRFAAADMAQAMSAASVVAVPSVGDEAVGLVSAEAQACGTFSVVTNSGGLPETVDHGETGIVVPRADAAALADAIAASHGLPGDPRRFATERFNLRLGLDLLEKVYGSARDRG